MLETLAGVLLPVLACVACGYIWARSGQPFDTAMVSRLVMTVGAPCLIISTLAKVSVSLEDLQAVVVAYAFVQAITLAAGLLWLRVAGLPWRDWFNVLMFPNVGNMGLPLCLLAFGDAGLALALAWFTVNSVLHFSLGIMVASGHWDLRHLITNPVVMASLLAMALLAGDVSLPGWLTATLDLVGGFTIPMMLITLGVALAKLPWRGLGASVYVAVGRLLIGLAAGVAVAKWLALSPLLSAVVIIQSSMPVAVFNYLFAQRYGQRPEQVAAAVMVSTMLAFAGLPLLLAWLLSSSF